MQKLLYHQNQNIWVPAKKIKHIVIAVTIALSLFLAGILFGRSAVEGHTGNPMVFTANKDNCIISKGNVTCIQSNQAGD